MARRSDKTQTHFSTVIHGCSSTYSFGHDWRTEAPAPLMEGLIAEVSCEVREPAAYAQTEMTTRILTAPDTARSLLPGGPARRSKLALGLVALTLCACAPFDALPERQIDAPECGYVEAREARQQAESAHEEAQRTRVRGQRLEDRRRAVDAAQRREADAEKCEQRAREWSDLAAQWQSARAAVDMANTARDQRLLTIGEILALLATIGVGVWAIIEARRASSKDLEERGRPEFEIILSDANLGNIGKDDVPRHLPHAAFRVRNIGGRAAIVTYRHADLYVVDHPPIPSKVFDIPMDAEHEVVAPGGWMNIPAATYATWTDEEEIQILARDKLLFAVGYIEYTDRLGIEWECGFCYYLWIFGTSIRAADGKRQGVAGKLTPWASRTHNFDRRRRTPQARGQQS